MVVYRKVLKNKGIVSRKLNRNNISSECYTKLPNGLTSDRDSFCKKIFKQKKSKTSLNEDKIPSARGKSQCNFSLKLSPLFPPYRQELWQVVSGRGNESMAPSNIYPVATFC